MILRDYHLDTIEDIQRSIFSIPRYPKRKFPIFVKILNRKLATESSNPTIAVSVFCIEACENFSSEFIRKKDLSPSPNYLCIESTYSLRYGIHNNKTGI